MSHILIIYHNVTLAIPSLSSLLFLPFKKYDFAWKDELVKSIQLKSFK